MFFIRNINKQHKLQLVNNITLVSGICCALISLLLILNCFLITTNESIEDNSLEALIARLKEEPNNAELLTEIRNFDVLSHKAFFNSKAQIKTCAFLLVFATIVLAIAVRYYFSVKSRIRKSRQEKENKYTIRLLTQKWILLPGAAVFVIALISSFVTVNHLNIYSVTEIQNEPAKLLPNKQTEIAEIKQPVKLFTTSELLEKDKIAESANKIESKSNIESNTNHNIQTEINETKEDVIDIPENFGISTLTTKRIQNNHNSFRGPWGNGISFLDNIPTDWDGATAKNLIWKTEIPKQGYNSPVIWDEKIFISGGDNSAREVYCFQKNTGKLLWSKKADDIDGSPKTLPKVDSNTGFAASTLTTDGEKVFAVFATGDIIAFDLNGNRNWARNIGIPDIFYGYSSSPITWANKLFIQFDTNNGGKLLALDVASGETIWEISRKIKQSSWASPVLAEIKGSKQIILTADPIVAAYNPETGKELWSVNCISGEVSPSVAVGEEYVYAVNEYAQLVAIDPAEGSIKWKDDEYLSEVASPVVSKGLLFITTCYGDLVCYDSKTGEKLWEKYFDSGFYSSPMIADNKVYALDLDGVMHIFEVSNEVKEINSPKLGEEAFATPAFSEGRIYIRGENHLFCFGK